MEIKKLDPKSNLQILENLSLEKYKRSDYHYTNKFELVGIVKTVDKHVEPLPDVTIDVEIDESP